MLLLLLPQASDGIETLRRNVDTLIVIPNDRSAALLLPSLTALHG